MKRKKKTSLPRVTLLAYDRKSLLAFSESVDGLRFAVNELRMLLTAVKEAVDALPKKRAKRVTADPGSLFDTPIPPAAEGVR